MSRLLPDESLQSAITGFLSGTTGAFTAVSIGLAPLFLTPLLFFLPNATLAATIIAAVLSLVILKALKSAYIYSRADVAAMAATILVTLREGVEAGLAFLKLR
jgi:sulfate permease, SulP family